MATPTPKSDKVTAALEGLFGRTSSITGSVCVPAPFGCGRTIDPSEIDGWPEIDAREYAISGLCSTCQARVFGSDD